MLQKQSSRFDVVFISKVNLLLTFNETLDIIHYFIWIFFSTICDTAVFDRPAYIHCDLFAQCISSVIHSDSSTPAQSDGCLEVA